MDKKNTAPASNANPNDATARLRFEAVVVTEGTVGGKPARIALYGTRYAACEVESGGAWIVHQDVGFGGIRGVGQLKQYLDDVAVEPAPVVAVVAQPVAEAFGLVGNPAVEVVPAAVEPEPVVEAVAAPVEPVLATLEEVRAAFDAETRGACRASVLRALRVRAGEIALGLPAGGKAEKVKAERIAREAVVVDPTKAKASDVESLRALLAGDAATRDGSDIIVRAESFTTEAGFPATAREKGNHWRYDRPGVKAAAALGYSVRFDGRSGVVRFSALG